MKCTTDYSIGSVHQSNGYGTFRIIADAGKDHNNVHMYRIKFDLTGYETVVHFGRIRTGAVRDPYYPNVVGVGYLGEPDYDDPNYNLLRQRWVDMLHRCYNPNREYYPVYGGAGVRVCEAWKCFATFQQDVKSLYGYGNFLRNPNGYQLDKDIKQQGLPKDQMVYGPDTCMWVPSHLNSFYTTTNNGTAEGGYYGVSNYFDKPGMYKAHINHDGKLRVIGVYETPELAAGAYNCFVNFANPYLPRNQARTLTADELVGLDLRNGRKEMCRLVN